MESGSRIKDINGRLKQGEDELRRICKEYFEDLYKYRFSGTGCSPHVWL